MNFFLLTFPLVPECFVNVSTFLLVPECFGVSLRSWMFRQWFDVSPRSWMFSRRICSSRICVSSSKRIFFSRPHNENIRVRSSRMKIENARICNENWKCSNLHGLCVVVFSRGVQFIVIMFFRVTVTVTVIASLVDAIWRYVFFWTSIVIEVFGRVQWRQKAEYHPLLLSFSPSHPYPLSLSLYAR